MHILSAPLWHTWSNNRRQGILLGGLLLEALIVMCATTAMVYGLGSGS